jgi:hypothetical protein
MRRVNVLRLIVIFIFILLFLTLFYRKPGMGDVLIATSPDAFVSPAVSNIQPKRQKNIVLVGITPAPWPSEAREIFDAAQRGKLVHVTVSSKDVTVKFEVAGVSESGDLQVKECSISDVELFRKIIGIR